MNFIVTNAGIDGDPYDLKVDNQIIETAERRNVLFLPGALNIRSKRAIETGYFT